jgi:hypothetical protein
VAAWLANPEAQPRIPELAPEREAEPERRLRDAQLVAHRGDAPRPRQRIADPPLPRTRNRARGRRSSTSALRSQIEATWTCSGGAQLSFSPRGLQLP